MLNLRFDWWMIVCLLNINMIFLLLTFVIWSGNRKIYYFSTSFKIFEFRREFNWYYTIALTCRLINKFSCEGTRGHWPNFIVSMYFVKELIKLCSDADQLSNWFSEQKCSTGWFLLYNNNYTFCLFGYALSVKRKVFLTSINKFAMAWKDVCFVYIKFIKNILWIICIQNDMKESYWTSFCNVIIIR